MKSFARPLARPLRIAIASSIVVLWCAVHAEPAPAPPSELALPSVEAFTKLRMAYAAQKDFNPMWKVDEARDAILEAHGAKDYAKSAKLAKAWLDKIPVDADIHYVCAQALKALGDWSGAAYHWHCFYGLIASVASSGDGKTPKTAMKVISVAEEYYFLNQIRAELVQQALQMPCDVMHVKLSDGTEATFYFDVSISMDAMARALNIKKPEPEKEKK